MYLLNPNEICFHLMVAICYLQETVIFRIICPYQNPIKAPALVQTIFILFTKIHKHNSVQYKCVIGSIRKLPGGRGGVSRA